MRKIFFLIFLIIIPSLLAQTYNVSGVVTDSQYGKKLSFANLRIENTTRGTATNKDGKFNLKLIKGSYNLIASYIGYKSDTIKISVKDNLEIEFSLEPNQVEISEVTVIPGENPAIGIIEKAIKTKNEIKNKLDNYKYSAYTKGIVKTTRDFQSGNFTLSTADSGKLKITGVLENESRGFFKNPDNFKHFIVARKQTANTPSFINILTGGNVLQSFYEDDLQFMGRSIPSPISDNALEYYYYYIENELALDNKKVFQIFFNTENPSVPGFYGRLYIADSTFHLLKVDIDLNTVANPGGLFEYVKVYQQFTVFENNVALPVDYRLFAQGNYLGLAKFGFELHTLMNSYEIDTDIDEDLFDNAIITVLPDADQKNENYWNSIQRIPNTREEISAYSRIDSLSKISRSFSDDFSLLKPRIKLSDHFELNGPLSIYSFNKVEGSALNLDLYYNDGGKQRLALASRLAYGFADKIVKKSLEGSYKLGNYRTTELSFNFYDTFSDLFSVSENYDKFTSTFLSLLTNYDFRDYYYTKGYNINVSSDVLPILNLGIGYHSKSDNSAKNNSDFAFFYNYRKYSSNEQINDVNINAFKASFLIDFRKFIEDGFFRRRIPARSNIMFEGSVLYSSKDYLKSDLDFALFNLEAYGSVPTINDWSLDFYVNRVFSNGTIPFQYFYALPGNISAVGKINTFRTLDIGEVYGDDVLTIFLKHNFRDDLFRLSQIPILKDLQLQLSTHLDIGISQITEKSKEILMNNCRKFSKPFYELGFGIGHILVPINLEFTWKLNYTGRNNFIIGLNTTLF